MCCALSDRTAECVLISEVMEAAWACLWWQYNDVVDQFEHSFVVKCVGSRKNKQNLFLLELTKLHLKKPRDLLPFVYTLMCLLPDPGTRLLNAQNVILNI